MPKSDDERVTLDEARAQLKKLKAHPSTTVRRIGEALEDVLRAVEDDDRSLAEIMAEVEEVVGKI